MQLQNSHREESVSALRSSTRLASRPDAGTDGKTVAETVERMLADIRDLGPKVVVRIAEIETGRRMPPDLVEALKSIGAFRLLVPRSHGGLGFDLPSALQVIAALARIDGSLGWTVAIASGGSIFAPLLPRETYEQIYRDGPDAILAGSIQPVGKAEAVAGGWRVSGRWPFASGCQHAAWMAGFCVMSEGGKPLPGPAGEAGPPLIQGVILPAREWQIEDTWHAGGLKGTGSHHIVLKDAFVPAANVLDLATSQPCLPAPLSAGVPQVLPLLHGAFSVGMAEGTLAELAEIANTGRQQFRAAVPMRRSEVFQSELGRVAADVRAARAFLQVQAESHWRHALAGTLKDEALSTQATQTGIWLATTAARVTDACFALGGGSAVYDSSPLQRRLRDQHVAAQHAVVQQRHYVEAGKLLLGDPDRKVAGH